MVLSSEDILAQYLDPGERLLWSGQPCKGLILRPQDAFLIPFSILWCGFAIFWETSVILHGAPVFFMLWGVPFVCVGLFLVFGRFFFDARCRERTYYGVTNERVLIVSGGIFSQQIKSLQLRTLTDLSLIQRAKGRSTVSFGQAHPMNGFLPGDSWLGGRRRYSPPCFDLIENAKEVYDVIRKAQKASS